MLKRKVAENLRHPKGLFGHVIASMMNYFNQGIITFSIDQIQIDNASLIVEVGIGSGKGISELLNRFPNAQVIGVDISDSMLERSRIRNKPAVNKGQLKLIKASIAAMDIESESIDTLFTINTLYFWNDPDLVCKELQRILRPGGDLLVSFNPSEDMRKDMYPSDIFTFYTVDEVKELLEKNNFQIKQVEQINDRYERYACIRAEKKTS
jgi:ubiquinone/menaquinone biosynthesis C-methylase UbiE